MYRPDAFPRILAEEPFDRNGRDVDEAHHDHAAYLSELSSDIPESTDRSKLLFTTLPHPLVRNAKWPANRIPLLGKMLDQQNRHLQLYILHRPAQGEAEPMHGIPFDYDYRMEHTC